MLHVNTTLGFGRTYRSETIRIPVESMTSVTSATIRTELCKFWKDQGHPIEENQHLILKDTRGQRLKTDVAVQEAAQRSIICATFKP